MLYIVSPDGAWEQRFIRGESRGIQAPRSLSKFKKKLAKILIGADVQRTRGQADMSSFIENPYLFT